LLAVSGTMQYDEAGNLSYDNYTTPLLGQRNFDAEKRQMIRDAGGKIIHEDLNQATQHWYSTGSGSDRAPFGEGVSVGARSLPLPVLYHRMYQCCLVRFRGAWRRQCQ